MNWLDNSQQIIAFFVLALWFVGVAFYVAKTKSKEWDWASIAALSLFALMIAVDLFMVNRDRPGLQKIWSRGWIGPRDQDGAITIGILEDPLGLTFSLLAAFLGIVLLSNRRLIRKDESPGRTHAGTLISLSGVTVAWLSLTPWLSLFGLMLAGLGGVVSLGANRGRDLIAQFGRERVWGFLFGFVGAAVLAGGRAALTMDRGFLLSPRTQIPLFDWIGAALLVFGLFLHLHPVPFSDWLSRVPRTCSACGAFVAQGFSAIAAFAILTRFEPQFRTLGILDAFEWVGLAAAILGSICGLAQSSWKTALPLWISSAFSLSFAILCYAGPRAALPLLIGTLLSGCALSLLASAREAGALSDSASSWHKALSFTSVVSGLGLVGFVSSGGFVRALAMAAQDPLQAVLNAAAIMLLTVLLWKCVFSSLNAKPPATKTGEPNTLAPLIGASVLLILSLGLIWSGTVTGGVIPHDPDRLFDSWFGTLLGISSSDWGDGSGVVAGEALFWSVVLVFSLVSFWLFGRGKDRIGETLSRSEKLQRFLRSGYSIERVGHGFLSGLLRSGTFLEKWINQKISTEWIPRGVETCINAVSRAVDWIDQRMYLEEGSLLRQWVDVPSKTLQLVQNGDLQWYLIFAIGCIAAVLIHFLKL